MLNVGCSAFPPIVLTHSTAAHQFVAAACDRATESGVRPGMTLAQARALCPNLQHEEHDPAADAKSLQSLARHLTRFTPTIQVGCSLSPREKARVRSDRTKTSTSNIEHPTSNIQLRHPGRTPHLDVESWMLDVGRSAFLPPALLLDITGTHRLFGPPQNLLQRIHQTLTRLHIRAHLAIAPTPGAAWALTYSKEPLPVLTNPTDIQEALAPLPPTALRLPNDTLALLHHLGLKTLADILRLPRDSLPARFGPDLLLRLDQATGQTPEPLTPLPWRPTIQASIEFDGPVDSLETLWQAFQSLIEQITQQLTRQGAGAKRLIVTFTRPHADPIQKTIDLSAPTRSPTTLFNLIRCTMETIGEARRQKGTKAQRFQLRNSSPSCLSASVPQCLHQFTPKGFTALRLAVPLHERLTEDQIHLHEQEEHTHRQELARLIERLKIRLGEQALLAVEPLESHIPERAYRLQPIGNHSALGTQDSGLLTRPLHLLPTPREIAVMVRPSYDRDGAPIAFTLDNQTRPILHAVGPERIAGAWWDGHNKTRDYFDVEDQTGRRWWLFRVFQTSRWFLHGVFE